MIYCLTDFGSTFTKVAIVDADRGRLLASAQRPTTVDTDVVVGFRDAEGSALAAAKLTRADRHLAASSAAGGLRMTAVGLVDDLTAAAARRTALGAGAKVETVFSGRLGDADADALDAAAPDVILFAGGTDGGERERVLSNARAIAAAAVTAAVVVACNNEVAIEVADAFATSGHPTVTVANLLPAVDRENSEPARRAIRELFIARVIRAKGLSVHGALLDSVVMPTPAAVLACAELLARRAHPAQASGGVVIVDVGGATTDVHSVLANVSGAGRVAAAAPAPARTARTVEGDLGVRWNADSVLALDAPWLLGALGCDRGTLRDAVDARRANPSWVPCSHAELAIDRALASSCVALGLIRHAGRISTRYLPGEGADTVLAGRDLRAAGLILATGGPLVHGGGVASDAVEMALGRIGASHPVPRAASHTLDAGYLAAAAGLLAVERPAAAWQLMASSVPGLAGHDDVDVSRV